MVPNCVAVSTVTVEPAGGRKDEAACDLGERFRSASNPPDTQLN